MDCLAPKPKIVFGHERVLAEEQEVVRTVLLAAEGYGWKYLGLQVREEAVEQVVQHHSAAVLAVEAVVDSSGSADSAESAWI